jgi:hypothetical protein
VSNIAICKRIAKKKSLHISVLGYWKLLLPEFLAITEITGYQLSNFSYQGSGQIEV